MPEPIAWQIEADLKSALENIDGTGNYVNTVTVQYASKLQEEFKPGVLYLELGDMSPASDYSNGKTDWLATFTVTGIVTRGALPGDQAVLRLYSDIQRAVMADPKRNSLAHDTTMLAPNFQDTSDQRVGLDVQIQVRFRTSETEPTSL